MKRPHRVLQPLVDRGPLRIMFVITSMPVGGAETLLVNLLRGLDRERFQPELCCLKELGPLGQLVAAELPVHSRLLRHKWDLRVLPRLARLLARQRIDALVTVGAGDKMFWGRLAARWQGVPVVLSALHSTGWPDAVGRLNRLLTPWTDGFIAVAQPHGQFMVERLGFPPQKVQVIPNGVDVERFRPSAMKRNRIRESLGISSQAAVCGIVAALRPEKNHELFLHAAARVSRAEPSAHFLIVGDGPRRKELEQLAHTLQIGSHVHFLGSRSDVPDLLPALDLFVLTSHNEANPVSVLEAMACEVPVVAPRVGSLHETVVDGVTGYLVEPSGKPGQPPSDTAVEQTARRWLDVLQHPHTGRRLGAQGRRLVCDHWSLARMVQGYEQLVEQIYEWKAGRAYPQLRTVGLVPTEP